MELPQPSKIIYLCGPELDGYRQAYLGKEIASGGEARVYKIDTTPSNDLKQPLLAKMYLGKPREDLDEFIQAVHDTGLGNIRPLLKEEPREVRKRKMYQTVAAPLYLIKFRENGETVGVAVRELDTRRFNAIEKFYGNKIVDNLHTSTLAAIRLVRLVSAIHQRGFVIGDFSASNVLIDLEGHIAFIDCDSFVLAGNRLGSQDGKTTANWRAPECKETKQFTFASDTFVLGLHIGKLLFSGIGPFDAPDPKNPNSTPQDNIDANRSWLWDEDIDAPFMVARSHGLKDLPPHLRVNLEATLSHHATQRPTDYTELLNALNETLLGVAQGPCGHYRMYGQHCRYCGSSTNSAPTTNGTSSAAPLPSRTRSVPSHRADPPEITIKPDPPKLQPENHTPFTLTNEASGEYKYGCIDYFIMSFVIILIMLFLAKNC